ncbi:MAG: hypothetical protein C4291_15120, partial [Candidatus Dadabacteria bacterium]
MPAGAKERKKRGPRQKSAGAIMAIFVIVAGAALASAATAPLLSQGHHDNKAFAEQQKITLTGAGATFPFPLIDTWRVQYQQTRPQVNINYQSIGSGGGIKQF